VKRFPLFGDEIHKIYKILNNNKVMANKTKYGVISDIHNNLGVVSKAIDTLKNAGVDKLLVNGDIGQMQASLDASQGYVKFVLDTIGKSGLEAYIQPGSHETFLAFDLAMKDCSSKYSNLINAIEVPFVDFNNHHLAFIPGSDWNAGGEYNIGNSELNTGTYIKTNNGLEKFSDLDQYVDLSKKGIAKGFLHYQNMNDLRKQISNPDKTIVVCHVPRKFDNIEKCVDMAYFAERPDGSLLPGIAVENLIRQQVGNVSDDEIRKIAKQNDFMLKRENRGNEDLKNLYLELGLKKAVSGHFHESGHRANDGNGNHVPQNTFVNELYWNSGHLDMGQTGILTVGDGKVSYRNINFK
jgi:Icc-related predicted phosphoesterase